MKTIKNILICGGGMMGSAIAQVMAGLNDVKITVYDKFPVDVEGKIRSNMKLLVEKEIVTEKDVDDIVGKVSYTVEGKTYETNLIAESEVKKSKTGITFILHMFYEQWSLDFTYPT